jgi:hypothetical protein
MVDIIYGELESDSSTFLGGGNSIKGSYPEFAFGVPTPESIHPFVSTRALSVHFPIKMEMWGKSLRADNGLPIAHLRIPAAAGHGTLGNLVKHTAF